jgi:pyruvate formate lyase activating enzyme
MTSKSLTAKVHSLQSLGTLDGPGVRYVVFLQGCPLRCKCCHNPDTWVADGGTAYTSQQLLEKALRFKEYFGKDGGVTLSGGEPLLQSEFATEFFRLCHENDVNTCLDTSGCIIDEFTENLLNETDRVLLDIKYTSDLLYKENVGCSIEKPLAFLDLLEKKNIPTTIRQVIIPTLNDSKEQVLQLKKIASLHKNVDKIELLPFKKICQIKYDNLKMDFPFKDIPTPTKEKMAELENLLK